MHLAAFHPRAHTLLSLRHRLSEAKDLLFPYRPPSSALYKVSFHFYLYLISFPKTEKKIPFSSFFSMFIFKGRVPPPFVLVLWMDHILHADWILYIFSWAAADEKECESYSRRPHRLVYLIPFPVQRVEEEGVVLFFFSLNDRVHAYTCRIFCPVKPQRAMQSEDYRQIAPGSCVPHSFFISICIFQVKNLLSFFIRWALDREVFHRVLFFFFFYLRMEFYALGGRPRL